MMKLSGMLNTIQKYQRNFSTVQKCICLSILTVVAGGVSGWWGPAAALHSAVLVAVLAAHQFTAHHRLARLTAFVTTALGQVAAKTRTVLRLLPRGPSEEVCDGADYQASVPEVELSRCMEYVFRDFVQSWYAHISDEPEFLDEAELILGETSLLIVDRVQNIDIHNIVADYVNLIRKHIVDYQEATKHLHIQPNFRHKKDRTKEFKKVKNVVESFSRLGKCHLAVKNGGELELAYLRMLAESMVKVLMPDKLYRCPAAKDLILEILTCQVLQKLVDMFSRPDFLHKVMVLVLSDESLVLPGPASNTCLHPTPDTIRNPAVDDELAIAASPEKIISTSISDSTSPSHNTQDTTTTSDHIVSNHATNVTSEAESPAHILRGKDDHTNPVGPGSNTMEHRSKNSGRDNHQRNHLAGRGHQIKQNVSPQNDLRAAPSIPPWPTSMSEVRVETVESGTQDMYISDALSKHFKISASNVDTVKVVETLKTSESESRVTTGSSLSPSPSRSLSVSPDLSLALTGSPSLSDADDAVPYITFRPSFFIPSDDEMSVHSNSSSVSGDQGAMLEDCSPSENITSHTITETREDTLVHQNRLYYSRESGHDITDSNQVPPADRNVQPALCKGNRQLKHVRNNSADSLLIQHLRTGQLIEDDSLTGLRRVASTDALMSHTAHSRPGFQSPGPSVVDTEQTEPQSVSTLSGPAYIPPDLPPEVQVPTNSETYHGPAQVPGLPAPLTEPLTEGPVEASTPDMPNFLFEDVHIDSTEKVRDPSGSTYVIYLIKYRAWHLEGDTWLLRRSAAHRRYREFVTLQERLEEHPIYKKKIRDIKGPQRWKVLPFGQIEIHGIEARRKFLEGYLQMLVRRDQVGNSLATREFLAYEGDARLAFVKKASEVPRIDKVIARTFSGVINKLTTTRPVARVPGEPSGRRGSAYTRGPPTPRRVSLVDGEQLIDHDDLNLDITFSHSDQKDTLVQTMENALSHHLHTREATDEFYTVHDSPGSGDEEGFKDAREDSFVPLNPPQELQQGSPTAAGDPFPLTTAVLDLAVQLVKGRQVWVVGEKVMASLKVIAGEALDRFFHGSLDELTTRERWSHYVHVLTEALWPGGLLGPADTPSGSHPVYTQQHARACLTAFFPVLLPPLVGPEDFDFAVDLVMEVISHPTLNRHLVYSLLDAVVETAFPEVRTPDLQHHLLTAMRSEGQA